MDKFCSNCGKELKEGADVCLGCGAFVNQNKINTKKNKKNKALIASFISISSLIFIVIIAAIISDDSNSTEKEEYIFANVGDELICENYKVVINSFQYKTGYIDNYQKIPDGEEWIGLIVTVTNTSSEERTIYNSDFNIINTNGEILTPDSFTYKVWGVESLSNPKLSSNGVKTGYIAFTNNNIDNSDIIVEFACNRNDFFELSDTQKYKVKLS